MISRFSARLVAASFGRVRQGWVRQGFTRFGMARLGIAGFGSVWGGGLNE